MTDFDFCFEQVVGHEGGYTDDRRDRGNWTSGQIGAGMLKGTKYGISAMSYPTLNIKDLTLDQARAIYFKDYWRPSGAELCPQGPSLLVFDAAVNAGNLRARKWLQAACGTPADGVIGPNTRKALYAKLARDPKGFMREFQAQRTWHHMKLDSLDDVYGLGWSRRICDVLMVATEVFMENN